MSETNKYTIGMPCHPSKLSQPFQNLPFPTTTPTLTSLRNSSHFSIKGVQATFFACE